MLRLQPRLAIFAETEGCKSSSQAWDGQSASRPSEREREREQKKERKRGWGERLLSAPSCKDPFRKAALRRAM